MVDVKTEERHAHEHEILLGKYENGNLNIYLIDTSKQKVAHFYSLLFMIHTAYCKILLYFITFPFLVKFIFYSDKDIITSTINADNVSPFVLFNQKPYQLPVSL